METKTELYKALAAFQQEVPTIHKGKDGYGYSYAELSTILEKINPLMKKHGLGFTQLLNGDNIKTIVFHAESGQSIESETVISKVQLKGMNDYQAFGSGITYFRRYCLSAILGVVTDKDTDASGEQKPPTTQPTTQPKAQPKKAIKDFEAMKKAVSEDPKLLTTIVAQYELNAAQLDDLQTLIAK